MENKNEELPDKDWSIKISKASNGFVLYFPEETFPVAGSFLEVIEEDRDEKETMTRLLEKVAEYFGIPHDKFAKDNLRISWNKKGSKT